MMHKLTGIVALLTLPLLLVACADVGDAAEAETGEKVAVETTTADVSYVIEPSSSMVNWRAAKVTASHDGGFNDFSGSAEVVGGELNKVVVDIATPSIFSDSEKLTGHLQSPDFFDVAQHPTARFEASTFETADTTGATHMVTGNLTMMSVTKSVRFPATIAVNESGVTATADFIINRQEWGMAYPGMEDDLISDDVRIMFDIKATAK